MEIARAISHKPTISAHHGCPPPPGSQATFKVPPARATEEAKLHRWGWPLSLEAAGVDAANGG